MNIMRDKFRRLADDRSGTVLVEFAMALPLLLACGLVGIEVANFTIANLRVSQIAMSTADNAARVRDSIDESDINELFIGARLIGTQIRFGDNGRIILSSLEPKSTTGQWIRWQRCYGMKNVGSTYGAPRDAAGTVIADGTERTKPSSEVASTMTAMGPATNQIQALNGTAVMFVEVVYDYQPIVWNNLLGNRTLSYTAAFNVRQRSDQVLRDGGLPSSAWSRCNRLYS